MPDLKGEFSPSVVAIFRQELVAMTLQLNETRDRAIEWGKHPDWPWNGFVLSYATLGGSANWEKRVGPSYDLLYAWDVLASLTEQKRIERLDAIGNPRFNRRVSQWAYESYDRISRDGGPGVARIAYLQQTTAHDRIKFIRSFPGFGAKYGRNIPMDRYDELVRDHFALDHRLRAILTVIGFPRPSYRQGEQLLRSLATILKTDAWTLDRLIYARFNSLKLAIASAA